MNIKEECISVYKAAFEESPAFDNRLFEVAFSCCRYLVKNGKIASILFALPCYIETENGQDEAVYIFAAATSPEFRKQGFMTELLEKVKKEFECTVFLRPASKNLIEFYKSKGFKEIKAIASNEKLPRVIPSEILNRVSGGYTDESGKEFTLMSSHERNLDNLGFIYSME